MTLHTQLRWWLASAGLLLLFSSEAAARNIFLNGKDISSAAGQRLDNVNIFISNNGDVFITAPQYQVHEQKSFSPLARQTPPPQQNADNHPRNLPSAAEMLRGAPQKSEVDQVSAPASHKLPEFQEKAGTRTAD